MGIKKWKCLHCWSVHWIRLLKGTLSRKNDGAFIFWEIDLGLMQLTANWIYCFPILRQRAAIFKRSSFRCKTCFSMRHWAFGFMLMYVFPPCLRHAKLSFQKLNLRYLSSFQIISFPKGCDRKGLQLWYSEFILNLLKGVATMIFWTCLGIVALSLLVSLLCLC